MSLRRNRRWTSSRFSAAYSIRIHLKNFMLDSFVRPATGVRADVEFYWPDHYVGQVWQFSNRVPQILRDALSTLREVGGRHDVPSFGADSQFLVDVKTQLESGADLNRLLLHTCVVFANMDSVFLRWNEYAAVFHIACLLLDFIIVTITRQMLSSSMTLSTLCCDMDCWCSSASHWTRKWRGTSSSSTHYSPTRELLCGRFSERSRRSCCHSNSASANSFRPAFHLWRQRLAPYCAAGASVPVLG